MTDSGNAKYRVGVIGCGRKGTVHARSYALNPKSEIVAGADTDSETLELFCKRFGVPGYRDYREMIEKEKIDIAAPILPVQPNPEVVIGCARLGVKAICSEKPMAASLEDPEHFLAHDLRFHLEVARATQNTILSSLVTMTRRYLQEWIRGSLDAASAEEDREEIAKPDASAGIQDSRRARASLSLQQHTEILASLKRLDGPAAREAMAAHILSSSEGLRSRS